MYPLRIEEESIARNLLDSREKLPQEVRNLGYRQLSLFDDVRFRENFYEKIYVCNDTITGIFSAIYDAWKEGREEKG